MKSDLFAPSPLQNWVKGKLVVSPPKTNASNRSVILPTPVVEVLKAYRETVCGVAEKELFRNRHVQCGMEGGMDAPDGLVGETFAIELGSEEPAANLGKAKKTRRRRSKPEKGWALGGTGGHRLR